MVTAFSYRGKHNLIFPALSGDLATLLESNRPSSFASDEVIVLALANLASAIEQVHDFSARTIDLREIGCHHDLRPKNILVEGSQFVLADFGLSRFKDTSQDSDTMHKKGQGDYVAPECEDLDGDFSKHRIRRSSDIWSFGCIIAEVLTYMIRGSDGVEQFWKLRTYKVHQNKYHLFHEGPGQPSHAVELWLESLGVNLEKPGRLLLRLVKDMMSLEPDDRPRADEVAGRLRLIVLYYTTESIDVRYDELFNQVENSGAMVEVYIERARYRSWKEACGVTNRDDLGRYTPGFDFDMQLCLSLLAQVKQGLEGVANLHSTPRHLPFLPLRHLSNRLESLLPSMCRGSLQTCLERNVVGETENPAILQVAQELFQNDPINSNIGALASIKRMVFLLENHKGQTRRDMYIESERIQLDRGIADCAIGKIENQQGRPVLVEWVRYEAHLVDEQEGKNRLSRLDGIADFLSQTKVATSVRTLHCSNYFHDPVHLRFGLVFDFPKSPSAVNRPNNSDAEVLTLRQILEKFENRTRFPLLGDRFELALKLAQSIAEFHKADWLHKSISSFHIVFFPPPNVSAIHCLRDPYIVGINDSRPDAEGELTFGPADTEDSAYLDFQHPDYLKHLQRYCREFDYYSLGLVLLEIGLWESLSKMTEGWEGTPANVTKRLLSEKVPRLCRSMGYRYFCVVENCLKGDISAEGIKDGISSITPHLF